MHLELLSSSSGVPQHLGVVDSNGSSLRNGNSCPEHHCHVLLKRMFGVGQTRMRHLRAEAVQTSDSGAVALYLVCIRSQDTADFNDCVFVSILVPSSFSVGRMMIDNCFYKAVMVFSLI